MTEAISCPSCGKAVAMAVWHSHRRCHHCGQRLDVSEAEIRPPAPDVDPVVGSSPQYLDSAARLRRTESAGNLLPDGRIPLQVPRQRPIDPEKPVNLADYQIKSAQPAAPSIQPARRGSAPKLNTAPDAAPVAPAPETKSGKYRSGPAKPPAPVAEPAAQADPVLPAALADSRTTKSYRDMNRVPAKSSASRWLVPVGLVVGFTLTLAGVLYYLLVIAKR